MAVHGHQSNGLIKEGLQWKKSLITIKLGGRQETMATPQSGVDFLCLHFDRLSRPMGDNHGDARWPTFTKSIQRSMRASGGGEANGQQPYFWRPLIFTWLLLL